MSDNSIVNAKFLGDLSRPVTQQNSLSKRDRIDFFKISLKSSSTAKFQLSGLRANADLTLLDSTGKIMARSAKGGNKPEQVQRQLAAGDYFIQVRGRSSKGTKYKLTGSATFAGGGTNSPGSGSLENPIDLGTLSGGTITRTRDTAGGNDSPLYYKFQLGAISDTSIRFTQVSGGGMVELYYDSNRNGKLDEQSDLRVVTQFPSETSNTPISLVLPSTGAYFLTAEKGFTFNNFQYDLFVSTVPSPGNLPTDPGPEETTAYNLGSLSRGGRLEVKDYVGKVDETDVYRFNLTETTEVTLGKVDNAGDINVGIELFQDKNGNGFIDNNETIGSLYGASAKVALQAGNYFIKATQSNVNNTAYTLTVSA